MNGDGNPDVVVVDGYPGTVAVLLGNGDGSFQAPLNYDSGGLWALSVAVADVNADNKPDLVVAICGGTNGCEYGAAAVLLGNGDGTFQPAVVYDSGGQGANGIAIADVNLDGIPDLLCVDWASNAVSVMLGNGDGTFQPGATYSSGGVGPTSLVAADLNGEGNPDLVVMNETAAGYFGLGAVGVLMNSAAPRSPTTTKLVSNLNPVLLGEEVTYSATVTSKEGGAVTGWVVFRDRGWAVATVPLANNQAAYSTTYTTYGPQALTATYTGDHHNAVSVSPTLKERIALLSKTALTTSGSPTLVGQPVTFTATVTSSYGAIPDGELVTFYDNSSTALASVALVGGMAAYTTSSLSASSCSACSVKTHGIKATYAGDATFRTSTGWVQQLVEKYLATTSLSSSPNPSAYGQAVTFTAAVTRTGPYPLTGKVVFKDGTTLIATETLSSGVAAITKSKLAVGTHSITANYEGDAFNSGSAWAVTQTVSQAPVSMMLTSTPNPSTFGKSVKFTATLTSNGGVPSFQPVTFSYNGVTLGTANVSSTGVATFLTKTLPQGSDTVTAAYAGTLDYSSASATVTQMVN